MIGLPEPDCHKDGCDSYPNCFCGIGWNDSDVTKKSFSLGDLKNAAVTLDSFPYESEIDGHITDAGDETLKNASAYIRSAVMEIERLNKQYDLVAHLERQKEFSEKTFGPGMRTAGVCDHIRKELKEIEADPTDVVEWVDVILLALDGAWRSGQSPEAIVQALEAKLTRNESREWPDWRTVPEGKAIEHVRSLTISPPVNFQI